MRANGKSDHTLQLEPDVIAWLRLWSKRTGLTQGGLVDRLVNEFRKHNMAELPKPKRLAKAMPR